MLYNESFKSDYPMQQQINYLLMSTGCTASRAGIEQQTAGRGRVRVRKTQTLQTTSTCWGTSAVSNLVK